MPLGTGYDHFTPDLDAQKRPDHHHATRTLAAPTKRTSLTARPAAAIPVRALQGHSGPLIFHLVHRSGLPMSEKSFAVISVLSAVILGALFYPPCPAQASQAGEHLAVVPPVAAEPARRLHAPSQWSAPGQPCARRRHATQGAGTAQDLGFTGTALARCSDTD